MPELLTISRLTAGYGEAVVLDQVSLALAEGQSLALLGRNGMGKTTLINSIVGVTRFIGGSINLGVVVPIAGAALIVLAFFLPRATVVVLLVLGVVASVSTSSFIARTEPN